mmetsp:Transcript_22426/g.55485  ORF Transcript_22426/g.55485 Transcript_22426/m.55485 type:complete len:95 (-) Transcript_22426:234-518(-)
MVVQLWQLLVQQVNPNKNSSVEKHHDGFSLSSDHELLVLGAFDSNFSMSMSRKVKMPHLILPMNIVSSKIRCVFHISFRIFNRRFCNVAIRNVL